MTVDLDTPFRYELAEIIERGLAVYRPILSHLAMATFRRNFAGAIHGHKGPLEPWTAELAPDRLPPLRGTATLTAGQVALLGGTRPLRIVHSVVFELDVLLDGGDTPSRKHANRSLESAEDALLSLVAHHVVSPVKGQDAAARNLAALVDLGIAAQIASTMGALHDHLQSPEQASGDGDVVTRYFLGMVQAFGRITLTRRDQKLFSDHYIDAADVDDLVDDDGRDFAEEVALRHGFLKRLAKALRAQIQLVTGPPAPPPPHPELPASPRPKTLRERG